VCVCVCVCVGMCVGMCVCARALLLWYRYQSGLQWC
jgi:hypothetical protein